MLDTIQKLIVKYALRPQTKKQIWGTEIPGWSILKVTPGIVLLKAGTWIQIQSATLI